MYLTEIDAILPAAIVMLVLSHCQPEAFGSGCVMFDAELFLMSIMHSQPSAGVDANDKALAADKVTLIE